MMPRRRSLKTEDEFKALRANRGMRQRRRGYFRSRKHHPVQSTHIHEQWQPSDPLHGQNEEGDHGEVPAVWVALNPGQNLFENQVLGAKEETKEERK